MSTPPFLLRDSSGQAPYTRSGACLIIREHQRGSVLCATARQRLLRSPLRRDADCAVRGVGRREAESRHGARRPDAARDAEQPAPQGAILALSFRCDAILTALFAPAQLSHLSPSVSMHSAWSWRRRERDGACGGGAGSRRPGDGEPVRACWARGRERLSRARCGAAAATARPAGVES